MRSRQEFQGDLHDLILYRYDRERYRYPGYIEGETDDESSFLLAYGASILSYLQKAFFGG